MYQGGKFIDVLVLGDVEQKLKISLADPQVSIQFVVKHLNDEDDTKIGKH